MMHDKRSYTHVNTDSQQSDAHAIITEAEESGGNILLAYSGGKDSIVACHLATIHGFTEAVCDSSLTFNRAFKDARDHADILGLHVAYVDRFGVDYAARHPKWLMPPARDQGKLYALRQQSTVKGYAKEHGYDGIVYGRRTQENSVPKSIYQTKDGLTHYHPIRDWKLDHVWSYTADTQLPHSSLYDHRLGQVFGNTPWAFIDPAWLDDDDPDPWELMWDYDPTTVIALSPFHPEAKRVVQRNG